MPSLPGKINNQNMNNMETLKLDKHTAIRLHKDGNSKTREILESKFGAEIFTGKITDRVTSYEDAWEEADEETRTDCQIFPTDTDDVVAYKQLKVICKVFRGKKEADYGNTDQQKWFPVFKWSSGSGFGFSHSSFYYVITYTNVGSRLCVFDEPTADYLGKQFISIYRTFLSKNK